VYHSVKIILHLPFEKQFYSFVAVPLVALQCQYIVPSTIKDILSYLGLATHRIYRDYTIFYVEQR
jgi:hypothetical protein